MNFTKLLIKTIPWQADGKKSKAFRFELYKGRECIYYGNQPDLQTIFKLVEAFLAERGE